MSHIQVFEDGKLVYDSAPEKPAAAVQEAPPVPQKLGPQTGTISVGHKQPFGVGLNSYTAFHAAGNMRLEVAGAYDSVRVTVTGGGIADGFEAPAGAGSKVFTVNGDPLTVVVDAADQGVLWMSA